MPTKGLCHAGLAVWHLLSPEILVEMRGSCNICPEGKKIKNLSTRPVRYEFNRHFGQNINLKMLEGNKAQRNPYSKKAGTGNLCHTGSFDEPYKPLFPTSTKDYTAPAPFPLW
jgi:hypothetical protein